MAGTMITPPPTPEQPGERAGQETDEYQQQRHHHGEVGSPGGVGADGEPGRGGEHGDDEHDDQHVLGDDLEQMRTEDRSEDGTDRQEECHGPIDVVVRDVGEEARRSDGQRRSERGAVGQSPVHPCEADESGDDDQAAAHSEESTQQPGAQAHDHGVVELNGTVGERHRRRRYGETTVQRQLPSSSRAVSSWRTAGHSSVVIE
jgi:hypothetical protein